MSGTFLQKHSINISIILWILELPIRAEIKKIQIQCIKLHCIKLPPLAGYPPELRGQQVELHGQVTWAQQEHSRAQKGSGEGKQERLKQETASLQGRDTAEQDSAASKGHKRTMGRAGDAGAVGKGCMGNHYSPFQVLWKESPDWKLPILKAN